MFDYELVKNYYNNLSQKLLDIKKNLNKPLTLSEKILYSHAEDSDKKYQRGIDYVNFYYCCVISVDCH